MWERERARTCVRNDRGLREVPWLCQRGVFQDCKGESVVMRGLIDLPIRNGRWVRTNVLKGLLESCLVPTLPSRNLRIEDARERTRPKGYFRG